MYVGEFRGKVHSLNSGKVSIQIKLKALQDLSEWTLLNVTWEDQQQEEIMNRKIELKFILGIIINYIKHTETGKASCLSQQ